MLLKLLREIKINVHTHSIYVCVCVYIKDIVIIKRQNFSKSYSHLVKFNSTELLIWQGCDLRGPSLDRLVEVTN